MDVFVIQIATLALIYLVLALSYNVLYGYAGLTSLAHAAFWGIGAYTSTLAVMRVGFEWPIALLLAALVAGAIGLLIALPSLRLSGEYLLIASLGFQVIISAFFDNWTDVTQGPLGIRHIPHPRLLGLEINGPLPYLALAIGLAALGGAFSWRLSESPFGRALKAVREDEISASALGKNVVAIKITAFVTTAALAAIAGSFYAHYVTYIDPQSFLIGNSFLILTIVAVGGSGNFFGPVVGVAVVFVIPEMLRFLNLPVGVFAPLRQVLFGLLLVLFMVFRPQGLRPEYRSRASAGTTRRS